MRMTQFIGLKAGVKSQLVMLDDSGHADCPTCICNRTPEKYPGKYKCYGMFDEEIELSGYSFKSRNEIIPAYEAVQSETWSSGPVIFTALEDKDGNWIDETLWSEEEMKSYL